MKVFISQPMKDLKEDEILEVRKEAVENCQKIYGEDIEIIESYFNDIPKSNKGLFYLGKSIALMAEADVVYFCKGWEKARGCKLEHACALAYGIDIIEDYKKEKTK